MPAAYVTAHVQLGYASTVHRVQGTTVDTAHAVITPHATRESLYVAASRARQRTDLYVATEDVDLTAGEHPPTTTNPDARDLLTRTLAFPATSCSATGMIRDSLSEQRCLEGIKSTRQSHAQTRPSPAARHRQASLHRGLGP